MSEDQAMLRESLGRLMAAEYGFRDRASILAAGAGWSEAMWARFAALGRDAGAAALRRVALPRTFDFELFNTAPRDQQIEPIGPGTSVSLEGLSPDGAPCSGQLPHEWPEIHGLWRDGQLTEIPLTCDTLWIDTDRNVC